MPEYSTDPLNLHPHELNAAIYGTDDLPLEFLRSIEMFGVLTPLVVLEDGTIISGHRRWLAAKQTKQSSIPIRVVVMTDELDIAQMLIESNRQRDKTFSQKMREAEVLRNIEAERARKRQENQDFGRNVEPQLTPLVGQVSRAPQTDDIVGKQVGIGGRTTYNRAQTVWNKAQAGDREAERLVKQLDDGQTTITAAYNAVKGSAAEVLTDPVESGSWQEEPGESTEHWWESAPAKKTLWEAVAAFPILMKRAALTQPEWEVLLVRLRAMMVKVEEQCST